MLIAVPHLVAVWSLYFATALSNLGQLLGRISCRNLEVGKQILMRILILDRPYFFTLSLSLLSGKRLKDGWLFSELDCFVVASAFIQSWNAVITTGW